MADPLSIAGSIAGVIGLAFQITQAAIQFGLDWNDAPREIRMFKAELRTLMMTLSATSNNILFNPDFAEAFQNRFSVLLSELGPNASSSTDTKKMLEICERELIDLLNELCKRAKGHRVGWERMKGAFLTKRTRESIENLHRWCQDLNNLVVIDTAALEAATYREVVEARKDHQVARLEQQEARKEQQKWFDSEASQKLLTWLMPTDYGAQQSDSLGRRQEGTGQWLLDSDEFQGWCDGRIPTLFCPGMPGAGKTIMSSVVIDYLTAKYGNATDIGIAYLYCNFRRTDEQRSVDLLASLLKQLLLGLSNMPEGMTRLYEAHRGKQTRPSFDEIAREFRAVANSYSRCFFVVDALDEFQVAANDRRRFLSELFDLQMKAASSLFATSRFIPDIMNESSGNCASLEIRASDEDVRRYLDGQMTRLPGFVRRNTDLQEEVKAEIIRAVRGMRVGPLLELEFNQANRTSGFSLLTSTWTR
jgi:hypothetical protein